MPVCSCLLHGNACTSGQQGTLPCLHIHTNPKTEAIRQESAKPACSLLRRAWQSSRSWVSWCTRRCRWLCLGLLASGNWGCARLPSTSACRRRYLTATWPKAGMKVMIHQSTTVWSSRYQCSTGLSHNGLQVAALGIWVPTTQQPTHSMLCKMLHVCY